ncbi:MAG: hypothetical protein KC996_08145 [Phycisphaerales bacterium]|nr:hypothetical protein [Phycisphaerales bacterium]
MNIKAAILAVSLLSAAAMAQPVSVGMPCEPVPDNADAEERKCYEVTCAVYRILYAFCEGNNACEFATWAAYLNAVSSCSDTIAYTAEDLLNWITRSTEDLPLPPVSLPIYAIGSSSPFVLSLNLAPADTEPVPEGVIVLSDGTWYEPTAQN